MVKINVTTNKMDKRNVFQLKSNQTQKITKIDLIDRALQNNITL